MVVFVKVCCVFGYVNIVVIDCGFVIGSVMYVFLEFKRDVWCIDFVFYFVCIIFNYNKRWEFIVLL